MRNPDRILGILELLKRGWQKYPDFRLGQIMDNLKSYMKVEELFYVEDDTLTEAIIDFFDLDEV